MISASLCAISWLPSKIGVWDLVARGYSIPGGSGVTCRTLSDPDSTQTLRMNTHARFGQHKVTFGIDHPPCTEWRYNLYGHRRLASYNKTNNNSFGGGHVGFRRKKMCAFRRSSGLVVTRRDSTACPRTLQGQPSFPSATRASRPPRRDPTASRPPRRLPFHRSRPGLGGPPLLSAEARAIVGHD